MQFHIISRDTAFPDSDLDAVYLKIDHWNDFSFVTMFEVKIFDENGIEHQLQNVKIGFVGQTEKTSTYEALGSQFQTLPETFFSLGTDVDYYRSLAQNFSEQFRGDFLSSLRDVVFDPQCLEIAVKERVFQTSHLRGVSISAIENQFTRVLAGDAEITDFEFRFVLEETEKFAGFELEFDVTANSKPSTNLHSIIGRNGVGKTTLLNEMIRSIVSPDESLGRFEERHALSIRRIRDGFFSSLISVSFSAFDPFSPPPDQPDPSLGTCYFYIGLKDYADDSGAILKSLTDLQDEFVESLDACLREIGKRQRWLDAISTLESDDNFAEMKLGTLSEFGGTNELERRAKSLMNRMSSGHAIVLLTITKLISRLEEKTLVLFDEPESHLHPPLLSALIRALSNLMHDRNAVAIIATHSPVVLQEIPKSCVWKITRSKRDASWTRPEIETFGENLGLLTREVFGLEVSKSGFNALLHEASEQFDTYEDIIENFNGELGFEGRAILRSIIHEKQRGE